MRIRLPHARQVVCNGCRVMELLAGCRACFRAMGDLLLPSSSGSFASLSLPSSSQVCQPRFFLLRRTKIIPLDASLSQVSKDDLKNARYLSLLMDGLPL